MRMQERLSEEVSTPRAIVGIDNAVQRSNDKQRNGRSFEMNKRTSPVRAGICARKSSTPQRVGCGAEYHAVSILARTISRCPTLQQVRCYAAATPFAASVALSRGWMPASAQICFATSAMSSSRRATV